jgi:A/G-specific adenine glycosylase
LTAETLTQIRTTLLGWYDENRRDLPWRSRNGDIPDAYSVWVSEVMLQQTRVETVRSYFERWIAAFPTLDALAAASQEEVLKAWEGLGYYSRARNLHRAVREVVASYGGTVPSDPERFRSLPGVGRYTAGAVASIAFGREEPIVDGNVRRVLSRLQDVELPGDPQLWRVAKQLVAGGRPGDLNQALMDFGATVCTPKSPGCRSCPLGGACLAHSAGTVEQRPGRKRRPAVPEERYGVAVLLREAEVLIVKRPETGRLGGLWEFPGSRQDPQEDARAAAHRAFVELLGPCPVKLAPLCTVPHALTHVRLIYDAFIGHIMDGDGGLADQFEAVWCEISGLEKYAFPRAQQRIASTLRAAVRDGAGHSSAVR